MLNLYSFQFQEAEKKRYRAEQQRFETKHRRQLEESRATANSAVKELEQLQVWTICWTQLDLEHSIFAS